MQPTSTLKRTPFYPFHKALGAKLVDFAGFEMPLRYTGDVREHQAVRTGVGLFDVSHMGEFRIAGPGAEAFLNRMVTNDVSALEEGQALYTPMCMPSGGIVDDILVYRCATHFMLVVNASNVVKDLAWLTERRPGDVQVTDESDDTALLAIQGPRAAAVLAGHVPEKVLALGYYRFALGPVFGAETLISRTGYTGEDGFELYFHPRHAERVWRGLEEAGRSAELTPVGLGARDTLRLEAGYMLYGNDIDETTSPLEAGLAWTVKSAKPDFVGKQALTAQREQGPTRALVGLEAEGRRVPRHDMVVEHQGAVVGRVTSGAYAPTLERAIAMAYVSTAASAPGTALEVVSGATRISVRVVPRRFYTRGSHR